MNQNKYGKRFTASPEKAAENGRYENHLQATDTGFNFPLLNNRVQDITAPLKMNAATHNSLISNEEEDTEIFGNEETGGEG